MLTSGKYSKGRIEIWVRGDCLPLGEHESTRLRVLDEDEMVKLLQQRLGKSEGQIHDLLASYRCSDTRA